MGKGKPRYGAKDHSQHIELISMGMDGARIEELLTCQMAGQLRWLDRTIAIGDAGLVTAKPLLDGHAHILDRLSERERNILTGDGPENLYYVGADGDAHSYLMGIRSRSFYVDWHDWIGLERVAGSTDEFLQWVIHERSDHLEGCPWEVFRTSLRPRNLWHGEERHIRPLYEAASQLLDWERSFLGPNGFELLDVDHRIDIRFDHELRGRLAHFRILAEHYPPELEAFLADLDEQGFGTVW